MSGAPAGGTRQGAPRPPLARGAGLVPGYTVSAHLRRGVDLDTYDVWSEERACSCVAKVVRPDRRGDPAPAERLLREGRLLRRFDHPHLVRAYQVFTEPQPVVILETLTGPTLDQLIAAQRRGRLPLSDLLYLGLHLCSALHYLHRHRTLHLDLKPSNIIVDSSDAKLLDLSIARPPGPGRRGYGTRQYMAPEQARGERFSTATDVWGLGTVLYEAATGRPPFNARGDEERYEQLARRAAPVRTHRRLPAPVATIVERCLAPAPADRPAVAAVMAALDAALAALVPGHPRPPVT